MQNGAGCQAQLDFKCQVSGFREMRQSRELPGEQKYKYEPVSAKQPQ
jgi:hypothetical protein